VPSPYLTQVYSRTGIARRCWTEEHSLAYSSM